MYEFIAILFVGAVISVISYFIGYTIGHKDAAKDAAASMRQYMIEHAKRNGLQPTDEDMVYE